MALQRVSVRRSNTSISHVTCDLKGGQVLGIAGVSGNGQTLLSDLVCGLVQPQSGTLLFKGSALGNTSPAVMVAHGIARIPEDRHSEGLIGDMSVTENVISESYRTSRFSRRGFIDWAKAKLFAEQVIVDYAVKCPGPDARVRLLSGGNMQKLILGRVMSDNPSLIVANQPTRGLDVGAVNYVHEQLLGARARGAAILLISEDLDELMSLSDCICVMYRGQLSAPVPRVDATIANLGLMMAGHGFEHGEVRHAS